MELRPSHGEVRQDVTDGRLELPAHRAISTVMRAFVVVSIVRTLLIAALLLGPALSFAAPMPLAMQHEPGKVAMITGATDAAKAGCMDCPMPSKGTAPIAHNCDATCPAPVMLTVEQASPEPQASLTWMILSTPDHPKIVSRIEPPPPKSSSQA